MRGQRCSDQHLPPSTGPELSGSLVKKARPRALLHLVCVCVHKLAGMIRCHVDLTLADGMGLLALVSEGAL